MKPYMRLSFALGILTLSSSLAHASLGPGELFITNYNDNSVTVYSRTASGTATSKRTIRTGLTNPFGVLVDQLHGELFVTNNCRVASCNGFSGEVQVYAIDANYPNDIPKRTIVGSNTGLQNCTGLFLDILRQELYIANDDGQSIAVFPRTANGNVTPSRMLSGSATDLAGPVAVNVDLLHDELIDVNKVSGSGGSGQITVYNRTANGNVNPIREIKGAQTMLDLPIGMDVDLIHNEITVANAHSNSVLVFPRTASGSVAPSRELQGPETGLCIPSGVVMDVIFNEMIVVNSGLAGNIGYSGPPCTQSTTIYKLAASGDQKPIRTLDDNSNGPVSVAETLLSF